MGSRREVAEETYLEFAVKVTAQAKQWVDQFGLPIEQAVSIEFVEGGYRHKVASVAAFDRMWYTHDPHLAIASELGRDTVQKEA